MKEIIGHNTVTNVLFPILSRLKTEKYSTKNKLRKRLIIILLTSVLT